MDKVEGSVCCPEISQSTPAQSPQQVIRFLFVWDTHGFAKDRALSLWPESVFMSMVRLSSLLEQKH